MQPVRTSGTSRTSQISGKKYNDLNGNGTFDTGEPGLSGWTVVITKNGQLADSVTTARMVHTALVNLSPGVYTVNERNQSGWTQTYGNAGYSITAASGSDVSGKDFGNFKLVSVSGTKFNDVNGNGVEGCGRERITGLDDFP